MKKAFFCYESDFAMRWWPVIYYDEVLELKRENVHRRIQVMEIPEELLALAGPDGEVPLSVLKKLYPLKKEKNDENHRSPDRNAGSQSIAGS